MERPTKDQISALPLYSGLDFNDIKMIENSDDAEYALGILLNETSLGYDTESKPIFRKEEIGPGPTLIQLATLSQAFLFPTKFDSALTAAKTILSHSNIKKIGFGIKGDNKELRTKLDIDIVNTEDLSFKLKRLIGDKNAIGAKTAVAMVLKKRLSKGAQQSNWGAYPLSKNQILYAANDAHCAICVNQLLVKNNVHQ